MEFKDVVRRGKMVRSFTDEPVAAEVVRRILDTARRSPSAGFSQGVEFVVVVDEGMAAAFVGGDGDLLRELPGIPQEYIPIGVALLGHAAPDAGRFGDVSARRVPRRPYDEVVHEGRW